LMEFPVANSSLLDALSHAADFLRLKARQL
jgi:hypothetical protein